MIPVTLQGTFLIIDLIGLLPENDYGADLRGALPWSRMQAGTSQIQATVTRHGGSVFTDPSFERFVELYSLGKMFRFARANFNEHIDSGAIGAWALSMVGFTAYGVGIFTHGWISLLVMAFGTPLMLGWGIYVSRTPTRSGQRQHIADALTEYSETNKINELISYLCSHYTLHTSQMSWRKSIGSFLGTLWIGFFAGIIGSRSRELESLLSNLLFESAICLTLLGYLISCLLIHRVDRLVMALRDVERFDFKTKQFK